MSDIRHTPIRRQAVITIEQLERGEYALHLTTGDPNEARAQVVNSSLEVVATTRSWLNELQDSHQKR
jgi:cation transport ATPase